MRLYRLNVRFDLDNEQERQAVEYLEQLDRSAKKSRNRFIVEAVLHDMNPDSGEKMLQEIRQMLREEVSHLSVTTPTAVPADSQNLTAQQQKDNLQSVLDDLEMFG